LPIYLDERLQKLETAENALGTFPLRWGCLIEESEMADSNLIRMLLLTGLLVVSLFLFSYLLLIAAIAGVVLFIIDWAKQLKQPRQAIERDPH